MSNHLTEEQIKKIANIDHPIWSQHTATNIGEDEPTIFEAEGKILIARRIDWSTDSSSTEYFFPATATTRQVTDDEARWLKYGASCQERIPDSLRSELISKEGWRFPLIPESPDTSRVRTRTLVLNPTEQCNIRCTYCYYSGSYSNTREHRTLAPSDEALKQAVRSFITGEEHLLSDQQAVYFFGGEPLMGFKKIQTVMDLIDERKHELNVETPNLIFQVNTNGLLLNPKIVEYFIEKDIYLNISIDGPNHDLYRVDRRGRGTHDAVRSRVEWLADTWPEYFSKRVAIISVLSTPMDTAAMYRYFTSWPVALKALAWDFDLVLPGGDSSYSEYEEVFKEQAKIWNLFTSMHAYDAKTRSRSSRYRFAFSYGFLHRAFHRVLHLAKPEVPGSIHDLMGVQLLPGSALVLLGADEKYYSSYEHQSDEFVIGDSSQGVDYAKGIEQLRTFKEGMESSSCSTCWAASLCSVALAEASFSEYDDLSTTEEKAIGKLSRCRVEREVCYQAIKAKRRIEENYGTERIDEHRKEWAMQLEKGPRGDAFN